MTTENKGFQQVWNKNLLGTEPHYAIIKFERNDDGPFVLYYKYEDRQTWENHIKQLALSDPRCERFVGFHVNTIARTVLSVEICV